VTLWQMAAFQDVDIYIRYGHGADMDAWVLKF
jgi:hypothetical protein